MGVTEKIAAVAPATHFGNVHSLRSLRMFGYRPLGAASILVLSACVTLVSPSTLAGQTVQYRSPAGVEYRSQPDTGPIARAASALAADPSNVDKIIALGVAQSGARQFREAIQT